jgi:hypothetical protein
MWNRSETSGAPRVVRESADSALAEAGQGSAHVRAHDRSLAEGAVVGGATVVVQPW